MEKRFIFAPVKIKMNLRQEKNITMSTTVIDRRRTSFNLRKDVLEILKEKAKQSHHTLNTYVESVLIDNAYSDIPNPTTCAAIAEAKAGNRNPKEVYSTVDDLMNDLMAL